MRNCSTYNDKKDSVKPAHENTFDIGVFLENIYEYKFSANHIAKRWQLHTNPTVLVNSATTEIKSCYGTPDKVPDSQSLLRRW